MCSGKFVLFYTTHNISVVYLKISLPYKAKIKFLSRLSEEDEHFKNEHRGV